MKLRIFQNFFPVFCLILSDNKIRKLDIDGRICTCIHCQTVYSQRIQAGVKSQKDFFVQLSHSCFIFSVTQLFCLILRIFHSVIQKHLIIIGLFIAENKRHFCGSRHNNI